MRATLNVLATVAPEWLRTQVSEAWIDRSEKRFEGYCLPKGKAERKQYAEVIGADGFHLLSAIYSETAPSWLAEVPMVQVLRQVWVQQYYAPDGPVGWRTEEDLPPSALQIHSPYDAEARFSTKRDIFWAGYKVHLTETCDDDTPHLITHVETTPATTYDGAVTETIHTALLTPMYNCARIKLTAPRDGCKLWSMRVIMHTGGSHDQEQDSEYDT